MTKLLLVGDRADVLLLKYKLLEKDWQLKIEQCYSFESAELKLNEFRFSCLIYASSCGSAQFQRLKVLNQSFNVPIRLWRDDD